MNELLETRPKTLGDICAEHGVETTYQLDQFVTELDQALMKKQAWDYANPGFPNNVIVVDLERVDQRHFSPIAKFWVNQIIWFWYHHAISCARGMYRSPTRALAFAEIALTYQDRLQPGHPNRITRLLYLLLSKKSHEARKWIDSGPPDWDIAERETAEYLMKEYMDGRFEPARFDPIQ